MPTNSTSKQTEARGKRETQREKTRGRILQAVLDIMVEKGVRGVRHRAVAERAGVSLGSTTYHFSSIEDLIISAFKYWREQKIVRINPYYLEVENRLRPHRDNVIPATEREEMAAWICEQSVGYLVDQVEDKRYDRLVELSFYHESIRYRSLRSLLKNVRQVELQYLETVHRIMGSPEPAPDARITLALFRQLEQSAVMAVLPQLDTEVIRETIRRHLSLCFNVQLPPGPMGNG